MRPSSCLVIFMLAVAAAISGAYWWQASRPQIIVDALSDHLGCVSYAPYYRTSDSPHEKNLYIDASLIDADLALLAKRFDCVRTYSVGQGLHVVPELAEKHGLKVLMGIWIGANPVDIEHEMAKGIDAARRHPGVLRGVVVGNEVLLRGEQPASAMKKFIGRFHQAVPSVPVTYADVWEFWLRNPELADSVDFATIHILPYWEDRPIPVGNAVGHVSHIYHHVRDLLKGKPVMIGETGWPSYGRRRLDAVPGLAEQARFIREFQVRAELEKIPYNVIEAFDQHWKRRQEGAVGGYWGLYDRFGNTKFPFRGPVAEAPAWSLAALLTSLACWAAFLGRWREFRKPVEPFLLLLVSIGGGGACVAFWRDLWMANRNLLEWTLTVPFALFMIIAVIVFGRSICAWCARGEIPPAMAPVSGLLRWFRRNDQHYGRMGRLTGALRFAFLFGGAFVGVLLMFDPRYRDFPLALYSVPAIGLALLGWIQGRIEVDLEELVLAGLIGFSGIWTAIAEHVLTPPEEGWSLAETLNPQAIAWAGLSLLLAGAIILPVLTARQETAQHEV